MTNLIPLFVIPIIGLLLVLILPHNKYKYIGLYTTLLNLLVVISLLVRFDFAWDHFQFLTNLEQVNFGVDSVSLFFIVLTAILLPICFIISHTKIYFYNRLFNLCFLFILLLLNLTFTILDLFGFYISFEAIIIPMFLIIGV